MMKRLLYKRFLLYNAVELTRNKQKLRLNSTKVKICLKHHYCRRSETNYQMHAKIHIWYLQLWQFEYITIRSPKCCESY